MNHKPPIKPFQVESIGDTQATVQYRVVDGISYHAGTDAAVINALQHARTAHQRVRLWLGDTTTGKAWLEEWDVEGYLGNSMGPVKVPLLVHNSRSMGGGAILDHCIVRIRTTGRNGRELYRHPKLNMPTLATGPVQTEGYAEAVYADGQLHAQFRKPGQADRWIKSMRG